MSDKELDQLFQHKFDDFEPEVSPALWKGIAEQLDGPQQRKKKTRSLPVFWMAAASVVIVVLTGLWLVQPRETMKLYGKPGNQVTDIKKIPAGEQPIPAGKVEAAASQLAMAAPRSQEVDRVPERRERPAAKAAGYKQPVANTQPQVTLAANDSREVSQPAAAQRISQPDEQQHIQPLGVSNAIAASSNTSQAAPVIAMLPTEAPEMTSKRKIRSLGGLVNFVVSKVDPRDDKIIEFTDSDEGTEVSGINLGLLKIKSKNNTTNTTNK